MLTDEILTMCRELRRSDCEKSIASKITSVQSLRNINGLDDWVSNYNSPLLALFIIQFLDKLECSLITKGFCKIYIDKYLAQKKIATKQLQLVAITAVILAIKFNESFVLPLQDAVQATGFQYTVDQIKKLEQDMLEVLNYELRYTTPFCYLKLIRLLVPLQNEELFTNLQDLLLYTSFFKEFSNYSANSLLYGCFYYICLKSGLPQSVGTIILQLSNNRSETKKIKDLLKIKMQAQTA